MSAETQPDRLHALDAVRGLALMLGVVFHATMSFIPGPQIWIIADTDRSPFLAVLFFVLHMFRMTVFFLIAGFFARMMFHRRGPRGFIMDRLKRIAGPLVVGWPILMAMIIAVSIWAALVTYGGTLATLPKPPPAPAVPLAFPLTHLWFLYVLLLFYAATLLVRALVVSLDRSGAIRGAGDKVVGFLAANPISPLILAAPVAVALTFTANWHPFGGVPTPDSSLIPNLAAAVEYGGAFAFGWLLQRRPQAIRVWERRWMLNLPMALVASTAALMLVTQDAGLAATAGSLHAAILAALYGVSIWTWTFAMIGLAQKYLSGHSPARRYIADASYWIYLIHLPLIMALQVAVARVDMPWWVKFPGILLVAFPLMFASYHLLVRGSFIGAILNGKRLPTRHEPPAANPAMETA